MALVFLGGCESTPVTRIIIGDNLSSGEVVVSPGDEVLWVNNRTAPARIVFLDPSNIAKLATNETTSACFRDPVDFRYTVRMGSAGMTGEGNVPGIVKVGGQSTGQTGAPK